MKFLLNTPYQSYGGNISFNIDLSPLPYAEKRYKVFIQSTNSRMSLCSEKECFSNAEIIQSPYLENISRIHVDYCSVPKSSIELLIFDTKEGKTYITPEAVFWCYPERESYLQSLNENILMYKESAVVENKYTEVIESTPSYQIDSSSKQGNFEVFSTLFLCFIFGIMLGLLRFDKMIEWKESVNGDQPS